MATLEVKNLHVSVTDDETKQTKEILKGDNLSMKTGEIQGVTNAEFLRAAINARRPAADQISVMDFIKKLDHNLALLDMDESMTERTSTKASPGGKRSVTKFYNY